MAFQAPKSQEQNMRFTHENAGQTANRMGIKRAREIAEKRRRTKQRDDNSKAESVKIPRVFTILPPQMSSNSAVRKSAVNGERGAPARGRKSQMALAPATAVIK